MGSADNNGHLDVSHRGGETGFISLINEDTLRIRDYNGNSMFNTLCNFHLNPAAGILIIDYTNGDSLHMTGKSLVHLNEDDRLVHTGGAGRFWDFRIEKTIFGTSLYNFTSRFLDFSRLIHKCPINTKYQIR